MIVTLSESLRASAREAEKLTVDTINRHLKAKTNVKRLADELTAKNVSRGDLPKYLTELADEAKIAGGNTVRMRKLIRDAEKNIDKLAQGGAPTKDLKKAYSKVLRAVESGDVEALNASLKVAIDRKASYNNKRIARTELSKSYSKGFARQLQDHPAGDRALVKVELSSRHNVIDVCDYVTGADQYNYGDGVFPFDQAPEIPLHPNCLCQYSIVVVRDNDKRKHRLSEQRGEEYLSSVSEYERRNIELSMQHTRPLRKLAPLPKDQVKQTSFL